MAAPRSLAELVRVETADGLFLDGALRRPTRAGALPVDAFILIHGTGGNFYSAGVLDTFAQQAVAKGTSVLRINTRGHDGTSSIPGRAGAANGGATYERVSDAPLDITAWVNWLEAAGFKRVVLVGHSMGGVKAIYSQAQAAHRAVCGIIAVSPPRFAHEQLRTGPRSETFREEFARASELVADGRGEWLFSATQPLRFVATAAGYVEKYGPENRYDFVPLLSRVVCPTLVLIGSESIKTSAAFAGLPEAIAEVAAHSTHVTGEIVEGADIHYKSCDTAPFDWAEAFCLHEIRG